jgi:hypothetical protein
MATRPIEPPAIDVDEHGVVAEGRREAGGIASVPGVFELTNQIGESSLVRRHRAPKYTASHTVAAGGG